MRSKFKWIFTLLLALSMQFSFAQEKTVSGVISDKTGPLPGANIVVKGTTRSAQTDFDGKFTVKASQGEVLVVTFTGYGTQSITVGAANTVNVKMLQDGVTLEEVVVQGYGKIVKKERLNSATSSISAATIADRPNINFLQSIQAQAPGVAIAFNSGSPGSNKVDVVIRGESSLNASADPLYVIDGVPLNQNFFRNLNPNDIENVTILKDAAAASIYGNRGANGVIVITTKKGKFNNAFSVNYSSMYGVASLPKENYNMTNGDELLRYQVEQLPVTGLFAFGNDPANYAAGFGKNTDWRKTFYRRATTMQQNLSITSGGEKLNSYTSIGYMKQDGLLNNTDFQRFTFRSNLNGRSTNDKFTYATNFNGNFSKRRQVEQETRVGIGNNIVQNPVNGFLKSPGYLSPDQYVNGQQLFDDFGANVADIIPFSLMDMLNKNNTANFYNEIKIFASGELGYKLTKNLTYGLTTGIDFQNDKRVFANGPNSYLSIVRNGTLATPLQYKGFETNVNVQEFSANVVNRLNYNINFKEKHTLDVTFYTEYFKAHRRVNQFTQNGLNPLTWVPGSGTGYIPFSPTAPTAYNKTVSASASNAGMFSYFAVADYDYNGLFGIGASIRRDNSFKFTADNKWGTFYSVSGRLNLHKLDFIAKTNIFNELKLRGSYGTVGNQNVVARDVDATISPIFLAATDIRDLNSAQGGYQGQPSIGVSLDPNGNLIVANKDLKWETVAQVNVGLDFNIKNKLIGSIDWYKKNTTDLYLSQPVSAVNGIYAFNANNGELENRGIEIALRYKLVNNANFKFDVYANAAKNTNEIKALKLPIGSEYIRFPQNIHKVGGPAAQYFVVPYLGVNPATGEQLFLDINGNTTTAPTDADRRATGTNYMPVYQGGFGFDLDYKGFFVNSYFSFTKDFEKFDDELYDMFDPSVAQYSPVSNDLFNAWTPTNTNSNVPSTQSAFDQSTYAAMSDRFLMDSSYLRLKTVSFGYNFPQSFLKDSFVKGLKLYVQAENLLTWTKWRGLDPEGFDSDGQGKYPNSKTVSFGLDLKF